ncbi:RNA-binding cell elongation regulator Jag/EloR [Lederbergia lenta]|uniref:RNA-binding protein KhpB n=1 Tax=Lederbergia lenta TaxID=1467 RepID=A0A2X4X1D4_LEDLE|nr:RNA-binding cell elongation regulator Jag/EloR [Lederbergia lenta]MCM3112765.1 protein jag [Lederbergia lenta]MEC2326268.1 RNA-binding cell elongation regulator Jag/EloR [Lederbergia lenta]SQI63770.1 jag protein [Lederbergia lenta]
MREITATGQNVDKAVESALAQLNTTRECIDINIVDEGKRGLFGIFGSRPAVVEVTMKPDAIESAKEFLKVVLKNMEIKANIEIAKEDERNVVFNISGEKMGLLIGKRGQTVNSLQYLTQLAANRHSKHYITIILNPEDYRERRKDTLIQLAERLASKAHHLGKPVSLEPMPNYERKVVHTALSNNKNIQTLSKGEEPKRYVVIEPRKKENNK